MAVSEKQRAANQANAQKSTGPQTSDGKRTASQNALQHGLFSSHLMLDGENPEEFHVLISDLHTTLNPVGIIEITLVERIAANIWRQRRLIEAETATLELERQDRKIAKSVSNELNLGFSSEINENQLAPFDGKEVEWCQGVITEYGELETYDLKTFPKVAPLLYGQLKSDAEEDGETIEEYLSGFDDGLQEFVNGMARWCREQIVEALKRPKILKLAKTTRSKKMVLPHHYLELLARYQTTLDNQLYKAIKTFREQQDWRLKMLDITANNTSENSQSVQITAS